MLLWHAVHPHQHAASSSDTSLLQRCQRYELQKRTIASAAMRNAVHPLARAGNPCCQEDATLLGVDPSLASRDVEGLDLS